MEQPSRGNRRTYIVNFSCSEAWLMDWLEEQTNRSLSIREAIHFGVVKRPDVERRLRLDRELIIRLRRIINGYREGQGMDRLSEYDEGGEEE